MPPPELLLRRTERHGRDAPSRIDADQHVLVISLKDGGVVRLALDRPALGDPTTDSGGNQLSPLLQRHLFRPPAPNQQDDDERDHAQTENRDQRPGPVRSLARACAWSRSRDVRRDDRRARGHRLLLGLRLADGRRLSCRDGPLHSGSGGGPVPAPGGYRGGDAAARPATTAAGARPDSRPAARSALNCASRTGRRCGIRTSGSQQPHSLTASSEMDDWRPVRSGMTP
jgi:hypothetical protein